MVFIRVWVAAYEGSAKCGGRRAYWELGSRLSYVVSPGAGRENGWCFNLPSLPPSLDLLNCIYQLPLTPVWCRYVEKRLLEAHITRLNGELAERDKVDGDIEGCVTSMMERLREVEAENEQLRSQLAGALRAGTLQGQAGGLEGVAGM